MSTIKVKVCGMNDEHNLRALLTIPVDYVGFIFYKNSPRNCDLSSSTIKKIWTTADESVKKVGVFVDAPEQFVINVAEKYELDYVQLHGKESIFYCQTLKDEGLKIIKVFSMDKDFSFTNTEAYQYYVDSFLFDTKGKLPGGNGISFDWDMLSKVDLKAPYFLSGGIGKDDVEKIRAQKNIQMIAVDINSKFEIEPGHKNIDEIASFIYKLKKPSTQMEYVNVLRK